MSKYIKYYFLACFLYTALPSFAFQDENPDIDWFESFFKDNDVSMADSVLRKNYKLLQQSIAENNLPERSRILKTLGLIHLSHLNNYDSAMDYFIHALAIEDSVNLQDRKVLTYVSIAEVFERVGNHVKAAHFLKQARSLVPAQGQEDLIAFVLNKLGKTYAALGRIPEAQKAYEEALKFDDKIAAKHQAEVRYNLGNLFKQQGKFEESLKKHKEALDISRMIDDDWNEALTLNTIGELYRAMKNQERALANHKIALEIRQRLNDKYGLAQSYNNIAELYIEQNNFERAIANLDLALRSGKEAQAQYELRRSNDFLHQCYKALGDYEKALEYNEAFVGMNDLILNDLNEQKLLETQNQYDLSKKETEIQKLELDKAKRDAQIEAQKKMQLYLILFIVLILVIAVLIIVLYVNKRKSNKVLQVVNEKVRQQNIELQDLNATKDKFFSIISHDLKGPLNSLTSFSNLLINHTESLSKDEIRMLAKDLDKSLKNLFALLENLLEWSRSQTGNIEFKPEPFSLDKVLEENKELLKAQALNKNITIINSAKDTVSVLAHKNSVNTVVRNLISNAIKFTPAEGTITLSIRPAGNDVVVSIADTGVGMNEEVMSKLFRIDTKHTTKGTADEKGTGLGLILCKEFIEKNAGKIWVESQVGKGSIFSFSLPYTPPVILTVNEAAATQAS